MVDNLLDSAWRELDSAELRLLLRKRIPGPGQYDGQSRNKLYLPLADASCRLVLTYRDRRITAVAPGPSFDAKEWGRIREEIETSILIGPATVGRDYTFSSFRVRGSWRGERSGVQILPAPAEAPQAPVEIAEHPFILEFPLKASSLWPITNHRRLREHRKVTLLLNVLLAGRTSFQPRRPDHFWACVDSSTEVKWVQQFYFAQLGEVVVNQLSPSAGEPLEEIAPETYYARVGHDGKGLRVPTDLDEAICRYFRLSATNRDKLDRATFWMDLASRQWTISVSAAFASLVSAIESLTDRGTTHRLYCGGCNAFSQHEAPGAVERFRAFIEQHAPGTALRSRRSEMYALRSGILHGSELMQLDQDVAFGCDPPWWNERELQDELWSITKIAMRNWLKQQPA